MRYDYSLLAEANPKLNVLMNNGKLDFKNPASTRELTRTILKSHFNLTLEVPEDRLCPTVSNRLSYIAWIETLLRKSLCNMQNVIGIDIGTGALCIYPLLAVKLHPTWKFFATEIDESSFMTAQNNVHTNHLCENIQVIRTNLSSSLIPDYDCTFVMCNPPFYSSREELDELQSKKPRLESSSCGGADHEMFTSQGEVGFVSRLIEESRQRRLSQTLLYTSLLGKKSSVTIIESILERHKVPMYCSESFQHGKTRRWMVAWSFCSVWWNYLIMKDLRSFEAANSIIRTSVSMFASIQEKSRENEWICCFPSRNWTRKARRRKVKIDSSIEVHYPLTVRIIFRESELYLCATSRESRVEVHSLGHWLKGHLNLLERNIRLSVNDDQIAVCTAEDIIGSSRSS